LCRWRLRLAPKAEKSWGHGKASATAKVDVSNSYRYGGDHLKAIGWSIRRLWGCIWTRQLVDEQTQVEIQG